jgi:transposase
MMMMMMRDRKDREAIRENLQRWRDTFKRTVDEDARSSLHNLINGAERLLKELEGANKVH